ncbi:MAG: aquaporin [Actinomycetota bacterium]
MRNAKLFAAELIGTMILMLGGPGTAVLVPGFDGKLTMVALGFGFALLIAAYAVGPISGCHINPAVTLGMAVMRKIEMALVPIYWAAQIIGAILGGLIIWIIARGQAGGFDADPANFATNLWGEDNGFFSFGAMAVTEIVLTAVLMFVVLSTTSKRFPAAMGGLAVGITLALIHFISIPVDNTSVNPARSLGMAVFAGGDAMTQLWAFIVFPLIGAVVGVLLWLAADDASLEDTMLGQSDALVDVRDRAADAAGAVGGAAERATGAAADQS